MPIRYAASFLFSVICPHFSKYIHQFSQIFINTLDFFRQKRYAFLYITLKSKVPRMPIHQHRLPKKQQRKHAQNSTKKSPS